MPRKNAKAPSTGRKPRRGQCAAVAFSDDFTSARWFGREFCFTRAQRPVVEVLVNNWLQGTPALSEQYLLAESGGDAKRMRDLFRRQPAFGLMIVPGARRGTFRISGHPHNYFEKI